MKNMTIKTALLLLFIGEIFSALSIISDITMIGTGVAYLPIVMVVGFIITLIGVIKLRNSCMQFNDVFKCTIAVIALAIAMVIIGSIRTANYPDVYSDGAKTFEIINAIIWVFIKVIQLFIVIRTVEGAAVVTQSENNVGLGKVAVRLYIAGVAVFVICEILDMIFKYSISTNARDTLGLIFNLVGAVAVVASEVIFIIFLFKSYKEMNPELRE